ncbi:MAG: Icc-related predicted phosphoesterase [Kiritimatiellia bacterium]|jgi:Icc-related predicted phosphoesterase
MLRLAVIGDVHARLSKLQPVLDRIAREPRVDGVLLVGDLGGHELGLAKLRTRAKDRRYLESVDRVLRKVRTLGLPVYFVPGNHDLRGLPQKGNVDGERVELAGARVVGIGGAGPAKFGFAYEWDESEIEELDLPDADILLCHCPPSRTPLDRVLGRGSHVGSEAIRERASRHRGVLVCGHIHESPGACRIDDCLCLNVGGLGKPYGRSQVGWVVWDDNGWSVGHEDLEGRGVEWWTLQSAPDASTRWG